MTVEPYNCFMVTVVTMGRFVEFKVPHTGSEIWESERRRQLQIPLIFIQRQRRTQNYNPQLKIRRRQHTPVFAHRSQDRSFWKWIHVDVLWEFSVCGVFLRECVNVASSLPQPGGWGGWSRNKGPVWALLLGDGVVWWGAGTGWCDGWVGRGLPYCPLDSNLQKCQITKTRPVVTHCWLTTRGSREPAVMY